MENKTATNITYKLSAFKTLQFSFNPLLVEPTINEAPLIVFDSLPAIKFSVENNLITVEFFLEMAKRKVEGSDDDRKKFADVKTVFFFEVEHLKDYLEVDSNNVLKIKVDEMRQFLITIVGTSYSTMRGIISEKFKGTFMENFPLPMTDPSKFFKFPDKINTK